MLGSLANSFGDYSLRWDFFTMIPPVAGKHKYACGFHLRGKFNITGVITDRERALEVYVEFAFRLFQEEGGWLDALAARGTLVRADIG